MVHVHVQPRAGRTGITGRHGNALKIRVSEPPVDGRATAAAAQALAEAGGGPGRDVRLEDFWPRPEQEEFFRRLCLAHERLILPLMQSMLTDLGCDPHLYDAKLTGTNFGQRLNYYPPLSATDEASGAGRLLGHEDVDLFTFLPAPRIEGLQVLNRTNMKWVRLDAPRGTIVLNTGDMAT